MYGKALLALMLLPSIASAQQKLDASAAKAVFEQAAQACSEDDGRLWGVSLCGPIMLVDPATKAFVANRQDKSRSLQADAGVYRGTLAADAIVANTAVDYDGERWTQAYYDSAIQGGKHLLLHEMFHRIQPLLGHANGEGDNGHLDTLEGRYLLRLELLALKAALTSSGKKQDEALRDLMAIRDARARRFPDSAQSEDALERNEGLAEYTAMKLAHDTDADRIRATVDEIDSVDIRPSLVRSFAYATGPAYGLLIDRYGSRWHASARTMSLQQIFRSETPKPDSNLTPPSISSIALKYDGAAIHEFEEKRAAERDARVKRYRATLVDGKTMSFPNANMNFNFNPNTVVPLDDAGNVYPILSAKADWGSIDVTDGALIDSNWSKLIVAAPQVTEGNKLSGPGWKAVINDGWTLTEDRETGSFVVSRGK